jgi:hypothetical protein
MRSYDATVTRDGKWWMVAIPEIDGLTQARRLSEAEKMAREYVAVTLDLPLDSVAIRLHIGSVAGIDVSETLAEIRDGRQRVAELEAATRERSSELARRLSAANIPVRDIGTMMGVSFQRAHQLVTSQR